MRQQFQREIEQDSAQAQQKFQDVIHFVVNTFQAQLGERKVMAVAPMTKAQVKFHGAASAEVVNRFMSLGSFRR